jgi:hypothetical protein
MKNLCSYGLNPELVSEFDDGGIVLCRRFTSLLCLPGALGGGSHWRIYRWSLSNEIYENLVFDDRNCSPYICCSSSR